MSHRIPRCSALTVALLVLISIANASATQPPASAPTTTRAAAAEGANDLSDLDLRGSVPAHEPATPVQPRPVEDPKAINRIFDEPPPRQAATEPRPLGSASDVFRKPEPNYMPLFFGGTAIFLVLAGLTMWLGRRMRGQLRNRTTTTNASDEAAERLRQMRDH